MSESAGSEKKVTGGEVIISILGALSMAEETSLTARGIFDAMPVEVARHIVSITTSWQMASFDRKHWRSMYLDFYEQLGLIQSDPEDPRRLQITERGQQRYEDWLTADTEGIS